MMRLSIMKDCPFKNFMSQNEFLFYPPGYDKVCKKSSRGLKTLCKRYSESIGGSGYIMMEALKNFYSFFL